MATDLLSRLGHRTRRLTSVVTEAAGVWKDSAAADVRSRYLNPLEKAGESLNGALADRRAADKEATESIRLVDKDAKACGLARERAAEHAEAARGHTEVADQHLETAAGHGREAQERLSAALDLMASAGLQCGESGNAATLRHDLDSAWKTEPIYRQMVKAALVAYGVPLAAHLGTHVLDETGVVPGAGEAADRLVDTFHMMHDTDALNLARHKILSKVRGLLRRPSGD